MSYFSIHWNSLLVLSYVPVLISYSHLHTLYLFFLFLHPYLSRRQFCPGWSPTHVKQLGDQNYFWLTYPWSQSFKGNLVRSIRQELEGKKEGIEAEVMKRHCILTYCSRTDLPSFLYLYDLEPGAEGLHCTNSVPSYINHQLRKCFTGLPTGTLMKTFSQQCFI